ncbi:hypothetical protein ACQFX6_03155 [Streptomyces sp. DSM 41987]|uniref:hypothetical protein n=1 Tax=Streptomyces TaxID=1883 RepID=UPI0018DFCD77|nr:hypothetical protein [Streptomyces fildesensis]
MYTIVTLGPSGAGKTVYLAALWHMLKLEHPRLKCYLKPESRQQGYKLGQIYNEVAGPGEWPLPTDGNVFPEWTFSCKVKSQHGTYTALKVRYIDYAGDRLTDPQSGSTEQDRLEETLRNADALLGLLDGRKVLKLMRGNGEFLDRDMTQVFSLMQDCDGPIHFVITKWDLLAGHYSLRQIRERLMEHPDFAVLATSRSDWHIRGMPVPPGRMRLIPVSSVGREFAVLGADGGMHKRANARPRPLNVDVAFAAVLPDLVARAYDAAKADQERARREARGQWRGWFADFTRVVASTVAAPVSTVLATRGIQVPVHLIAAFLSSGTGAVANAVNIPPSELRKARRLQRSFRKRSVNAVTDDAAAAQFVLHRLVEELQAFERSPENDGTVLS